MSLSFNYLYKFGQFVLDANEKLLVSETGRISLTPTLYKMLLLLVENSGQLLTKDEILKKVWADSIVEEGNLTFSINQLRKLLDDNARQPIYIETVPRRGYRFIAQVEKITNNPPDLPSPVNNFKYKSLFVTTAIILLVSAVVLAAFWSKINGSPTVLNKSFNLEKVTDSGNSASSAISPDGKFIVYSLKTNEKTALMRKQIEMGENTEIIPPLATEYAEIYISNNGETLFFARRPIDNPKQMDIYRMPVFGGVPQKILSDTQGVFSVSLDQKLISFVRCPYRNDDNCSLLVANIDGSNEKKLVTKTAHFLITDNEFSPSENSIVFASGQSLNGSREFSLSKVFWETGEVKDISVNTFFRIQRIKCLSEKDTFLIAGRTEVSDYSKIFLLDKNGTIEPLTKDASNYLDLSLDDKNEKLTATQVRANFKVNLASLDNPFVFSSLADGMDSVAFSPQGKILYSTNHGGAWNLWEMNPDGSGKRQLTNTRRNSIPLASRDGKFIFFTANTTGEYQIWRMNADGSNQIQITKNEGGYPLGFSPDGQMLYYRSIAQLNLCQIPINGGDEKVIVERAARFTAISFDGTKLIRHLQDGEKKSLTIQSLPDLRIEKEFPLASDSADFGEIAWSPDGNFLIYAASKDRDISLWMQKINEENPVKIADLGTVELARIAISPNNKNFAVVSGNFTHDTVIFNGLK